MKLDIPKSIISLIISGLIAYGCYSICPFEELCCLLTGTTFGYLAITGLMTFGITINTLRNATVIKVFSGCMFFTGIVLNITFFFLNLIYRFTSYQMGSFYSCIYLYVYPYGEADNKNSRRYSLRNRIWLGCTLFV